MLEGSGLLLLKGDLNYRKLVRDLEWPPTTPLQTALGSFLPAPLVALRTCKSDAIVGLPEGASEAMDARDAQWKVDGEFALIQGHFP